MVCLKCSSCGTENPEGSRFCMSCASPLAQPSPAAAASPPPPYPPPPPRRHREPHEDLVGLLGLAFVLVAIASVFAMNANLPAELQDWARLVSSHNTVFVRPPEGVIVSAMWFFAIVGVLEFVGASLRWALRWTHLRVVGRVLSGIGDLVFATLLSLYAARTISSTFLIAVLAGTVGVLLMMYVSLGVLWSSARPLPPPEPVQPPTQQP